MVIPYIKDKEVKEKDTLNRDIEALKKLMDDYQLKEAEWTLEGVEYVLGDEYTSKPYMEKLRIKKEIYAKLFHGQIVGSSLLGEALIELGLKSDITKDDIIECLQFRIKKIEEEKNKIAAPHENLLQVVGARAVERLKENEETKRKIK